LFLVLFSHGIPGAIFYFSWFIVLLVRTRRRRSAFAFAAHVAILISLIESPFYDFLPTTLCVLGIASAVALRREAVPVGQAVLQPQSMRSRPLVLPSQPAGSAA
jgi:hypothetical protein